jgi:hypothetical protein
MPGPERLRKLKSRRVVHKSTGGVLPRTPEPVDPVGNPPSASSFNTVAHLPAAMRPASRNVHPHPSFGAASPATKRARRIIGGAERDILTGAR